MYICVYVCMYICIYVIYVYMYILFFLKVDNFTLFLLCSYFSRKITLNVTNCL